MVTKHCSEMRLLKIAVLRLTFPKLVFGLLKEHVDVNNRIFLSDAYHACCSRLACDRKIVRACIEILEDVGLIQIRHKKQSSCYIVLNGGSNEK